MKSDKAKKGIERAPHRALFKAMGYTDAEMERPLSALLIRQTRLFPAMFIWTK